MHMYLWYITTWPIYTLFSCRSVHMYLVFFSFIYYGAMLKHPMQSSFTILYTVIHNTNVCSYGNSHDSQYVYICNYSLVCCQYVGIYMCLYVICLSTNSCLHQQFLYNISAVYANCVSCILMYR